MHCTLICILYHVLLDGNASVWFIYMHGRTDAAASGKPLRWRTGRNFAAAVGASSEVKVSTAQGDFNLPRCCPSAGSLVSACSNLQRNPQPSRFPQDHRLHLRPSGSQQRGSSGTVKEARFCRLVPSEAALLKLRLPET